MQTCEGVHIVVSDDMFAVKVMPNFEIPSHKIYRNYEPLYNSGSMSTSVNPASENCISVTLQ